MIWSAFNKPAKDIQTRSVIIDWDGLVTPISNEYRDMGEKEGWLVFRGCVEYNGETILRYRFAVNGITCE